MDHILSDLSTMMVGTERGHQRADRLKAQSQKTSQSDRMDHSLVQLSETKPCHVGPPKMKAGVRSRQMSDGVNRLMPYINYWL